MDSIYSTATRRLLLLFYFLHGWKSPWSIKTFRRPVSCVVLCCDHSRASERARAYSGATGRTHPQTPCRFRYPSTRNPFRSAVTDAREKYTVRSRHDTTRAAALAPAPAPHHLRAVVFEAGRPGARDGRSPDSNGSRVLFF